MAGIPECEFVVAVTGHTRLNDEVQIRATVDRALREIEAAANQAIASHRSGLGAASLSLRMIVSSCLAAGADQLVAEAGLAAGYALHAILPGNPDEYRNMICFADDPQREARGRNAYDTLLHEAHGNVTNLAMPLPQGPANETKRHHAYDAATKYMLERSDLLIALVDVLHRKDLGMTGDAVRYAIRLGISILWIDPADPGELKWLGHLTEEQFIAIADDDVGRRVVAPIESHESVSKALSHEVASVVQSKCAALRSGRNQGP